VLLLGLLLYLNKAGSLAGSGLFARKTLDQLIRISKVPTPRGTDHDLLPVLSSVPEQI